MNQETILAALQEISRPFADRRVNVFEIGLSRLEGNVLYLNGRLLEESNLRALEDGLRQRFPDLILDASAVTIARQGSPRRMAVGTNLTSVHDSTSFLAEQVTQMLNGVTVEVLWQQERWGFVRQEDGYLGWTYLPYLTDQLPEPPTHLFVAPVSLLYVAADKESAILTRVLGGTAACASAVQDEWAQIEMAGGWKGWAPTGHLRALSDLPSEAGERRDLLVKDAHRMTGVPYLWGGCSANGIDCSGFAQLMHRTIGITIPRDADMQFAAGQEVEAPFQVGDLLFFGEKGEQRRITHVGISLGGWNMIHSSRSRNGVQVDDVQSVPHLRDSFLCAATYIGR